MEQRQDTVLGLLFIGLGLAVVVLARPYSGATGLYPTVLGSIMALLGFMIAVRAMRSATRNTREIVSHPINFTITMTAAAVYLALVVPLGFYTASVLLMLVLPFLLGFRRPRYSVLMTLGFVSLVFLVFSVVLEKPLPAEFWSYARLGAD